MVAQFILKGFSMPERAKKARKAKDEKLFQKEVSKIDREFKIYLRYTHDEKSFFLKTEKRIKPIDWNFKGQKPLKKQRNFEAYLEDFKKVVDEIALSLYNGGENPSIEAVKRKYLEKTGKVVKEKETLSTLWTAYIKQRRPSVKERTNMSERASKDSFDDFLNVKKIDPKPYEFNTDMLDKYKTYLDGQYLANTKAKKLKHLKQFLTSLQEAEDQKFNNPSLLKKIKSKGVPTAKVSLTESELLLFQTHDFSEDKRLAEYRDLFVLQCRTGLRVSDFKRLGKAHLEDGFIRIYQKKNKRWGVTFITPEIEAILKRYDYKLPFPPHESTYNLGIKEVARKVIPDVEIEFNEYKKGSLDSEPVKVKKADKLRSHDAIRTNITLSHQKGEPIAAIAHRVGKSVQVLLRDYLVMGVSDEDLKENAKRYEFAKPMSIAV